MRNKIVLRITSVVAAALVCAVWSLAGCSSPASSFGDDNQKNANLPELSELSLAYEGTEKNLLEGFLPENESYTVNIALSDGGKTVVVTATAKDGVIVEIWADGIIVSDGKVTAPGLGKPNVVIDILVGGTEGRKYSIELSAPQTSDVNDYSIKSLFVSYSATGNSLISNISGNVIWSINTLRGQTSAVLRAEAMSTVSPIEIFIGSQKIGSGEGNAEVSSIALPARGGQAVSVKIKIFKKATYTNNGTGESKTYTVTFNPPADELVKWTGTAEYRGTSGYTVVAVTANNSASEAQNADVTGYVADSTTIREWELEVDISYRPALFSVTLEKSTEVQNGVDENGDPVYITRFEQRQSMGYGLNAAQLASRSGIDLVVEDTETGIYINNANDFVKYLSSTDKTANYALAGPIDLKEYYDETTGDQIPWKGPVGYAGKFYGNGHTISGLIVDPPNVKKNYNGHASIALFSTIVTGAHLENFTVEVSTINQNQTGANMTLFFGGIVGEVTKIAGWTVNSPPATIKNVRVNGELIVASWSASVDIGGIVGVVTEGNIVLENCVSEIDIVFKDGNHSAPAANSDTYASFGGLIGTTDGTVTIRNSYARGNVSAKNTGNKMLRVGGLVGTPWRGGAGVGKLTIENSYAAGAITGDCGDRSLWFTNTTYPKDICAGGLLGAVTPSASVTITNSVALNPAVLAMTTSTPTQTGSLNAKRANYGRLVGMAYTNGTLTLTGNKARSDMLTGYAEPGAVEELAGDDTTVCEYDDLKTSAPWLELGFDEAVWDFSRISEGKGPTLK